MPWFCIYCTLRHIYSCNALNDTKSVRILCILLSGLVFVCKPIFDCTFNQIFWISSMIFSLPCVATDKCLRVYGPHLDHELCVAFVAQHSEMWKLMKRNQVVIPCSHNLSHAIISQAATLQPHWALTYSHAYWTLQFYNKTFYSA